MDRFTSLRSKRNRLHTAAIGATIALAGIVEWRLGRKLWGVNDEPGVWSGNILSRHNSQYLFDPYTFSHVTHGILLYALTWLMARRLPVRTRAAIAIAIEAAWEVFENTDFVIQRYRAETISLNYYGDSILNSMCDILACLAGFLIASRLPRRASLVAVVVLELALALWIRDGLLLNILMLAYPVTTVRTWQQFK